MASRNGHGVVVADGGLSLLRCFTGLGVPLTVADSDPQSLTHHSIHSHTRHPIANPATEPANAVADLIEIAKGFAYPPMLAFDNESMLLLASRHREQLQKYYRYLLPEPQLIEDLCCKLRFTTLSQRLDLPVPRSYVPGPDLDCGRILQVVGLPCVLKPTTHSGRFHREVIRCEHDRAYKALRADTLDQFKFMCDKMRNYCDAFMVQQYVPGRDTDLYSFHTYFSTESMPLGFFVGRKIRTYPRDSGFSSYLELVEEPEVVRQGLACLRKMNYIGPMKLDFKRNPQDGRFYLLECNPRFTLWNYLGAANGVNLPELAMVSLFGDDPPPQMAWRTTKRWLSFGIDARAFLREYRPAGEWTWCSWLRSYCSRKVYDVFSWRDPWPWTLCACRYLQANGRKLWRLARRLATRPFTAPPPRPVIAPQPIIRERNIA